ncbi:TIGR02452 family protein [Paenibacillus oryzisoli]|uniref:TIGR02452 family protein n=1 Tax=Paenibacillus oryzisoli TaxID=1850517 RepID=A0A197ZWY0_9BACL|nr:TIGR02452 family protein [Paenibacillus oryzisoli]OAS13332.1 TIGR02452 family protein [Paenibacillus oryzisoli]
MIALHLSLGNGVSGLHTPNNNREIRSQIAKETLEILETGFYLNPKGNKISVQEEIETAIRESKLFSPNGLPVIKEEAVSRISDALLVPSNIEVTNESTLAAARRLVVKEGLQNTLCLNFASAKNPGGGFLGGSQAQEESLARSSALYPCISQMDEMYVYNRTLKTCLYSHYMVYSPRVPVFRSDDCTLLESPYLVSVLTAPAVNAGVVREREPQQVDKIEPVMLERIRYILSVAAINGEKAIILGAYGCGVFRNNPGDVARMFKQVLINEGYGMLFDRIVFAILDKFNEERIVNLFKREIL